MQAAGREQDPSLARTCTAYDQRAEVTFTGMIFLVP